jgi:hypothetical protein
MYKLLIIIVLLASSMLFAQDETTFIELMKSDLKTEKKAVLTEAMGFTEEESVAFWPIYREYELEADKLADQRLALIKEYGTSYDNLTDEKADELIKRSFKLAEERMKLKKKYYDKLKKVMSTVTAAKFVQVENQIQMLMDVEIASALPLIEKPKSMGSDSK